MHFFIFVINGSFKPFIEAVEETAEVNKYGGGKMNLTWANLML